LFVTVWLFPVVWIEVMVAIDDWELDRAGLPGRIVKVGAGDGWDGAAMTGDALVSEGDAVAVGVGMGVEEADEVGKAIDVDTMGFWWVGTWPE
jgi:hypothetical protein